VDVARLFNTLSKIRNLQLSTIANLSHGVVIPHATYSPWLDDSSFLAAYKVIRENTLVDEYRCYELWSLVAQVAALEGDIIEVGVWRGGTGCLMAYRAQNLSPQKRVFLCDTFAGVVKAGGMDSQYRGGEHADTSLATVKELADRLELGNISILQGIFPEDTASAVEGNRFSLCHIDVDVYDSARDVMNWVWPRLCVGGCIVFDDYGFSTCDGVTRLVNENSPKAGAITLHNLNGHAIIVKIAP
jgi:O-methyltransferase